MRKLDGNAKHTIIEILAGYGGILLIVSNLDFRLLEYK